MLVFVSFILLCIFRNPVGASFFTLEKIEKHLQKKKKSSGESAGGELNIAEVHSEAGEFNPKFLWQEVTNISL